MGVAAMAMAVAAAAAWARYTAVGEASGALRACRVTSARCSLVVTDIATFTKNIDSTERICDPIPSKLLNFGLGE